MKYKHSLIGVMKQENNIGPFPMVYNPTILDDGDD